jgi:hypothetical protein
VTEQPKRPATNLQLQQQHIEGEIMLNQSNIQMPIAVRLYDNQTYGTTYGKGLYRKAHYNGTIDNHDRSATYLVDFYNYQDWVNQAKTDEQMHILANITQQADTLYSWIKHYDRPSSGKTPINGVSVLDLDSYEIAVSINDSAHGVVDQWILQAKPCKSHSGKGPQLLATNADLGSW